MYRVRSTLEKWKRMERETQGSLEVQSLFVVRSLSIYSRNAHLWQFGEENLE